MMTRILFLIAVSCFTLPAQAATIEIGGVLILTDLGAGVKPTAINNNGQIVGQDQNGQAFLWQNNSMTTLGTLGGAQSYANDINDNGMIVGWSHDDNGMQKAFRYDDSIDTMINIDGATNFTSSAEAVNIHGEVVGWKNNGSANRSSIWTENTPEGFLAFGGGNHRAVGVNDSGDVVGVTLNGSNQFDAGYFWNSNDAVNDFSGGLGVDYFPFAGINNHSLTAGQNLGGLGSFMFTGEQAEVTLSTLHPSDSSSSILGLNDSGIMVGESGTNAFAFDLSSGQMFDMNSFATRGLQPDAILRLTDINNQGEFVGVALINGVEHGFSGNIGAIPEPSGITIAAVGVTVVLMYARSRISLPNFNALRQKIASVFSRNRNQSAQSRLSSTILPPSANSCENAMRIDL